MPFTMTKPEDWYVRYALPRVRYTLSHTVRWYSLEINLKSPTELTRIVLPCAYTVLREIGIMLNNL